MNNGNNFVMLNTSLLTFHADRPIIENANKLKGFIASQFRDYPIFHNHYGGRSMLTDSRIQYKIIDGVGYILGIEEGAESIKMLSDIDELHIGNNIYKVVQNLFCDKKERVAKTDKFIQYDLMTPWVALNDSNYKIYKKLYKSHENLKIKLFLNRLLVANMMTLCRGVGLDVKGDVYAQSRLKTIRSVYKVGRPTFIGEFRTNVEIPDMFGIGGKVSAGFGVIRRRLNTDHYLANIQCILDFH